MGKIYRNIMNHFASNFVYSHRQFFLHLSINTLSYFSIDTWFTNITAQSVYINLQYLQYFYLFIYILYILIFSVSIHVSSAHYYLYLFINVSMSSSTSMKITSIYVFYLPIYTTSSYTINILIFMLHTLSLLILPHSTQNHLPSVVPSCYQSSFPAKMIANKFANISLQTQQKWAQLFDRLVR